MMARVAGNETPEGKRWSARLARAQGKIKDAERQRDELVRAALDHGLGIRGVARALGVDKMTAQRRYGRRKDH